MVKLQLSIKAELENVTDLVPSQSDFDYLFKVKCNSCHETHSKLVTMNRTVTHDEYEMSGGKGNKANFVWRCGTCKRESSAKFEPTAPLPYTEDANSQFAPLVTLDCRGLEFVGFDPQGIWECKGSASGTKFTEVDLSEGEWTDYDEKAALPVGIMNIESEWSRAP